VEVAGIPLGCIPGGSVRVVSVPGQVSVAVEYNILFPLNINESQCACLSHPADQQPSHP
jgi:hypothetical protein